jgi:hypothetical protein
VSATITMLSASALRIGDRDVRHIVFATMQNSKTNYLVTVGIRK